MDYKYDVFLSYRHMPLDGAVTQKALHLLEAYQLPGPLVDRGFHGVRRVFRDTEELPVTRVLSDTIKQALHATDCLVVVCSPDTPSSEWVDREVATFIELGRSDKIYPLLIAGSPELSFPPALKKVPGIEARLMDVRVAGGGAREIIKKEELALLKVIAAVSGCSYAELLRLHKLRAARRTVGRYAGATAVFALVFAGALGLWLAAQSYREQAEREQAASMAMLEQLTYQLPNRLAELPGTTRTVAGMLEENAAQIIRIIELAEDRAAVMPDIAANYEKLATAFTRLGDYELAVESQNRAIAVYEELDAGQGKTELLKPLASAYNNLGVSLNAAGLYADAAAAYDRALDLLDVLAGWENSFENRHLALACQGNRAVNAMNAGSLAEAVAALEENCAALAALEAESGWKLDADTTRAALNLGNCRNRMGDYIEAEAALREAVQRAEARYGRLPGRSALSLLAQSLGSLAVCQMTQAKFDEAFPVFDRAVAAQEQLAADRENLAQQSALAALYNNYGLCLNMSGDFAAAGGWYIKNAEISAAIAEQVDTPQARAALARACYNVAENAFKLGDYSQMEAYYDRCLDLYGPASMELGDYHRSEYLARLAYYQIIIERDFPEALENAAKALTLQPDSVYVLYNYAYALMYNGQLDACDAVFDRLAGLSPGEVANIRLDFEALTRAGLEHEHMAAVLERML